MKRLSESEYKERVRDIFGNYYNLDNLVYCGSHEKVSVICPVHGEFKIRALNLLQGHGCPKCAVFKRCDGKKMTTTDFILRASKVHGNRYNYDAVVYEEWDKKVDIKCSKHGVFKQTPHLHLQGRGCPYCANENRNSKNILGKDGFIKKAIKIHGEKYDYSKVNYVNNKTIVNIICPHHGEFLQRPDAHLNGKGCPICSESQLEKEVRIFLEKNNILFEREKKFDWLIDNGCLRLDFYLPDYNIAIECQGIQHYEPVDFSGRGKQFAESLLLENLRRDEIKRKLCSQNGIKIVYFSKHDNNAEISDVNQLFNYL